MFHIIGIILKIVFILLASLLGVFLLLCAVILFVPIRYRIDAHKYQDVFVNVKVNWLFKIISYHATYTDAVPFYYKLKIFGFTYLDSRNPKKKKAKKVDKNKGKKSKRVKKSRNFANTHNDEKTHEIVTIEETKEEVVEETNEETVNNITEVKTQDSEVSTTNIEKAAREKAAGVQLEVCTIKDRSTKQEIAYRQEEADEKDEQKRPSFVSRFINKIRNFFKSIKNKVRRFQQAIRSFLKSLCHLKSKIRLVIDFYQNEENKEGFAVIFSVVKKLLKHLLPCRIKGNVHFGLDDPCNTGYALGALSLLYPIYGKRVVIQPDFTQEILEGQITCKGRAQIFYVLVLLIRLKCNDKFKKIWSNFNEMKEQIVE